MFWGPHYWNLWEQRKQQMNQHKPKHLMAFNEPDVNGQSNMDATYAAELFMQEIFPWAAKGVSIGSPAIVWNLKWMDTFLSEIHKRGGHVDFICIHWYGSWNDLFGFKQWVSKAHSRYNLPIWVTEVGITTKSWPSQGQVKNFHMQAMSWLDSTGYAQRASWFGTRSF
jgi:hypothetical protein